VSGSTSFKGSYIVPSYSGSSSSGRTLYGLLDPEGKGTTTGVIVVVVAVVEVVVQ
jgi:hypothetical protein